MTRKYAPDDLYGGDFIGRPPSAIIIKSIFMEKCKRTAVKWTRMWINKHRRSEWLISRYGGVFGAKYYFSSLTQRLIHSLHVLRSTTFGVVVVIDRSCSGGVVGEGGFGVGKAALWPQRGSAGSQEEPINNALGACLRRTFETTLGRQKLHAFRLRNNKYYKAYRARYAPNSNCHL